MSSRQSDGHPVSQISAHAGCLDDGTGGTLQSYKAAADLGVDYVELDVRRTQDGVFVVFHDAITSSGTPVAALTLDQLQSEYRGTVLRMEDVLLEVRGLTTCQLDLKESGYEHEVLRQALSIVGNNGFVVTTLEDDSVRLIRQEFPDIRVGLSLGRDLAVQSHTARLRTRLSELFPARRVRACRPHFLSMHYRLASLTGLSFCRRHGLGAFVWTINSDRLLRRMLSDMRVDCVITEMPMHAQLIARGNDVVNERRTRRDGRL